LSGVLGLTTDERGKPAIPGVQVADLAGGMIAAFAILAALHARERTGRGQFVDVSMFDVMMSMLPIPASQQFAGRALEVGDKYLLTGGYPFYSIYETGDGRFMTLGALEPKFWENFCRKVGRDELVPRQFDDGELRKQLFEEVAAIFKSKSQAEWVELMQDADCCCEPVLSMAEAFDHPQARAREMVRKFGDSMSETMSHLGFAYKMSLTPPRTTTGSPALGQDSQDLLRQIGLSDDEIQNLRKSGIVKATSLDAEA